MPVSDPGNKKITIDILKKNNSKNILELGVGYGVFGSLIKNNIKDSKLFGIEIFLPYFDKIPKQYYDGLFNQDMRFFNYEDFCKKDQIDSILLIDSLEHLTREDGIILLDRLERICKLIIISVPIIDYKQGKEFGNEWEEHKTQWKQDEIEKLNYTLEFKNKVIGVFSKLCNNKF